MQIWLLRFTRDKCCCWVLLLGFLRLAGWRWRRAALRPRSSVVNPLQYTLLLHTSYKSPFPSRIFPGISNSIIMSSPFTHITVSYSFIFFDVAKAMAKAHLS